MFCSRITSAALVTVASASMISGHGFREGYVPHRPAFGHDLPELHRFLLSHCPGRPTGSNRADASVEKGPKRRLIHSPLDLPRPYRATGQVVYQEESSCTKKNPTPNHTLPNHLIRPLQERRRDLETDGGGLELP